MAADDRDQNNNDDDGDLVPRSHIKGLEEKARRADELAAENEQLKKDSVFDKALTGIDHPGLPYFKTGYAGDLTPEAIRQAAIEAGFAQADTEPTAPPATNQQPSDFAAHQRMSAAQVGAAPPPPFDPIDAINQAKTPEEVMAIVRDHGEKYGVIDARNFQ